MKLTKLAVTLLLLGTLLLTGFACQGEQDTEPTPTQTPKPSLTSSILPTTNESTTPITSVKLNFTCPTGFEIYKTSTECIIEEDYFRANKTIDLSICYPTDWIILKEQLSPLPIIVFSDPFACYGVNTQLELKVAGWSWGIPTETVESFFRNHHVMLQIYPEYNPISTGKLAIDDNDVIKHIFTSGHSDIVDGTLVYTIGHDGTLTHTYFFLKYGILNWLLSFSASTDCFDEYEDTFDTMAASFRLLD